MSNYDYDLFVIGAGSGGVRAARMAAGYGARVAVAEDRYLGGTCVNVGCVPKKLFVYGSHFAEEFRDADGFGWAVGERNFHWPTLRDNKTQEIERLNGIYKGLLDGAGVTTHWGRATLEDANTVAVAGQRYRCANILVATGGWPTKPEFPGSDLAITSNEAFYLDQFPGDVVVVGGGPPPVVKETRRRGPHLASPQPLPLWAATAHNGGAALLLLVLVAVNYRARVPSQLAS